MIRRLSISWEGELVPSPHGDYVEYRDVLELEEEVERLRKALEREQYQNKVNAMLPPAQAQPEPAGGRLFGWVNPDDARRFNSGRKESCRVFKKRTDVFCMPLSNVLGPNHYQKPPVGAVVTMERGDIASVTAHTSAGLQVACPGGVFEITKWSWKR